MIDSHCHLEYPAFDKDLPQVIENAKKAGVKAVVNAGNKPSDNRKVLAMQKKIGSNFFKAVLSLSPHFAPQAKESLDEELRFIESNKNNIVGIGETGLDFYHFEKPEDQKIQKKAFEAFLQLAESLDKPV
ncbi:MAG: TatD family hydrolase, partial [Candidatus Micrarchaeia archaeon]